MLYIDSHSICLLVHQQAFHACGLECGANVRLQQISCYWTHQGMHVCRLVVWLLDSRQLLHILGKASLQRYADVVNSQHWQKLNC